MRVCDRYLSPTTVDSALEMLLEAGDDTAIIAGGTDLLLEIQQGLRPPMETLIDVSGIPELLILEELDNTFLIGAGVTHHQVMNNATLVQQATCLTEACGLIGGPQVRNVATVGGNVAHALPAGDAIIALLALNTRVQIAAPEGRRWVALSSIFAGPGEVTFDRQREILIAFRVELAEGMEASVFRRVMRPQGVAIAILNMALWLEIDQRQVVQTFRLAVGPAGPQPFIAEAVDQVMRGRPLDEVSIAMAGHLLQDEVKLRTSPHRATKEYRHHLLGNMLEEVVDLARRRIGME
jgi:CO/xanthine dehydrogenase FAD-binding subunit